VHVVGRLPHPIRYAAVAALGRNLYIAGGSTPQGASHGVFSFDTVSRNLSLIARLPRPVTHAAATAFGCCVYIVGGREEQLGTPSRRIFAIQPGHGRVRPAGRLPVPLSDLGAVAQRRRILAIGGRTTSGTVSTVVELRPRP
jgi:N-acetylneuraminic acid mutarotase